MKVLIIGSGLIGLTTAYFLRSLGYEVTVIDRENGPGLKTSFANGALLTPAMSEPWNAPGCWRVLAASLLRSDAALQLRFRALPSLGGWGIRFLRNSRPKVFEQSGLSNLRLGLYSLGILEALHEQTAIDYGRTTRGSLKIFRDTSSLDAASTAAERMLSAGLRFKRLTAPMTVALEPALSAVEQQLTGAIHYEVDQTGDAYRFCVGLKEYVQRQGVEFKFNTEACSIEARAGRIVAVQTRDERIVADRYVVAAGSYSTPLLRLVGIRIPVRPAKGYSITFDEPTGFPSLKIPVIDDDLHAAVVPLYGAIRVAGTAEFAGFDLSLNPDRIENLVRLAKSILPMANLDSSKARPWCGLRPLSADGVPIIGATPIPNLWVNTGHGHLGWTLAAGSARLLADSMSGSAPAIDPAPFALSRFA